MCRYGLLRSLEPLSFCQGNKDVDSAFLLVGLLRSLSGKVLFLLLRGIRIFMEGRRLHCAGNASYLRKY